MKERIIKSLKRLMVVAVMLLLFLPWIQEEYQLAEVRKLQGFYDVEPKPTFYFASWFNESFQKQNEKYLNQNFGYRNEFVRLYNQFIYHAFEKSTSSTIVIGKKGYLFQGSYIDAYFGTDRLKDDQIKERTEFFSQLNDSLNKAGSKLLIVFTPGKGSFFPEYIPNRLVTEKRPTNLEAFTKACKELKLNFIDFNSHFLSLKKKGVRDLYPKTGIHWSMYGSYLAADSLFRYIENLTGKDLPDYKLEKLEYRAALDTVDQDLENLMNLYRPIPKNSLPYPVITILNNDKKKIKALVVSDSYYFNILDLGITQHLFEEPRAFWFYGKEKYHGGNQAGKVSGEDFKKIKEHDIVILMVTDGQLANFPWNLKREFNNTAPEQKEEFEKRVQQVIQNIKSTPEWYKAIEKKALEQKIPVDSMLRADAVFMVERE